MRSCAGSRRTGVPLPMRLTCGGETSRTCLTSRCVCGPARDSRFTYSRLRSSVSRRFAARKAPACAAMRVPTHKLGACPPPPPHPRAPAAWPAQLCDCCTSSPAGRAPPAMARRATQPPASAPLLGAPGALAARRQSVVQCADRRRWPGAAAWPSGAAAGPQLPGRPGGRRGGCAGGPPEARVRDACVLPREL